MKNGFDHGKTETKSTGNHIMKKNILSGAAAMAAMLLLNGCIALQLGGGEKHESNPPTIGQQLVDLQKAKDAGALTDAEFQAQKAKLLGNK